MADFLAFHRYRKHPHLGFVATLLLCIAGNIVFTLPLLLLSDSGEIGNPSTSTLLVSSLSENTELALLLIGFVGLGSGLYFGLRWIHKSPFRTLFHTQFQFRWKRAFFPVLLWFIPMLLFSILEIQGSSEAIDVRSLDCSFFTMVCIALLLIPIQSASEELLVRGYMSQYIGLWNVPRWIPIILSSSVFAALHLANPEVQTHGLELAMANYALMGVILGIITVMDNRIEIAIGIHVLNNLMATILFSEHGDVLPGDALYSTSSMDPLSNLALLFVFGTLYLILLKRILHWPPWSYLFQKIGSPK